MLYWVGVNVELMSWWEFLEYDYFVIELFFVYKKFFWLFSVNGWMWLFEWVCDGCFCFVYIFGGVVIGCWVFVGGGVL